MLLPGSAVSLEASEPRSSFAQSLVYHAVCCLRPGRLLVAVSGKAIACGVWHKRPDACMVSVPVDSLEALEVNVHAG